MTSSSSTTTSIEVYGFAAWISSSLGFVLFLAWAYLPDSALHAAGITYYPDKQWAILLPTWVICTLLLAFWTYESMNQVLVQPFHSDKTIRDGHCKHYKALGQSSVVSAPGSKASMLPLMHIPPSVVSRVIYAGSSVADALEEDARSWVKAE